MPRHPQQVSPIAAPAGVALAAVGGALVMLAAFLIDLAGLRLDFMGFSDDAAMARILREYRWDVVVNQAALLLTSLGFGAIYGVVGGLIALGRAAGRRGIARRAAGSRWR